MYFHFIILLNMSSDSCCFIFKYLRPLFQFRKSFQTEFLLVYLCSLCLKTFVSDNRGFTDDSDFLAFANDLQLCIINEMITLTKGSLTMFFYLRNSTLALPNVDRAPVVCVTRWTRPVTEAPPWGISVNHYCSHASRRAPGSKNASFFAPLRPSPGPHLPHPWCSAPCPRPISEKKLWLDMG